MLAGYHVGNSKNNRISWGSTLIRHEIPAVLSTYFSWLQNVFPLLWLTIRTVRQRRMLHKIYKGHLEFRNILCFARQPVQIHIHVQIAPRRHILCRRCRLQYEILSAPNKLCHTSVLLTNRADSLSNIGKTLYIVKRKICNLELRYFMPDIETC